MYRLRKLGYWILGGVVIFQLAITGIYFSNSIHGPPSPAPTARSTTIPTSTPSPSPIPRPMSTPRPPTPTPDPTKEIAKSIEAAAYIVNYNYKVEFAYLCDEYNLQKRIWDWEKDLTRFQLRVTDNSYPGTPKWHKEIRGLAEELRTLVILIDHQCIE